MSIEIVVYSLAALFAVLGLVGLIKRKPTLKTNAKFIRDYMDSIEYIDPDSPRHVDWLFGIRWDNGLKKTDGIYLEWQQEEGEFSFQEVLAKLITPEHWDTLYPGCQVVDFEAPSSFRRYVVVDDVPVQYMLMSWSMTNICISIIGDKEMGNLQKKAFDGHFITEGSVLYHELLGFGQNGPVVETRKVRYQEEDIRLSNPEFYPYLNNTVEVMAAEFKKSNENLMLLVGPPGTGKSTFLRTMVKELQSSNVFAVSSQEVLDNPNTVPLMATQPDGTLFVLEDADVLCRSRENGNKQMSQLLNMIDGVSSKKIKMIISTNLKTVKDVDTALMRPGRCFSSLQFKLLSQDEANAARQSIGKDILPEAHNLGDKLTLSEALNYRENRDMVKAPAMGFMG